MTATPKVSVIIPTYNRGYIIGKSINSVLEQTCTDYELIVVDDGSTDDTPELVRRIVKSGRPGTDRIRYVRQEQGGKSNALNHGLRLATGEWIAFLDSDDEWLPDKLERQSGALQLFPNCDVCFTDARYTNNPKLDTTAFLRAGRKHDSIQGVISDALSFVINEPHGIHEQTLVVRASRLRKVGGFDSNIRVLEDHDFVFRLAHHLRSFCFVNFPLVEIDRSPIRSIGLIDLLRRDEVRLRDQQYIYEKWLKLEGLDKSVRRQIHKYLRAVYSGWANWYLEQHHYERALQSMTAAIRHQWTPKAAFKWLLTRTTPGLTRRYLLQRERHT